MAKNGPKMAKKMPKKILRILIEDRILGQKTTSESHFGAGLGPGVDTQGAMGRGGTPEKCGGGG